MPAKSIEIDGLMVHIESPIIANKDILDSQYLGIIEPGEVMIVKTIYRKSNNTFSLGLYSDKYKSEWHDLEGNVENGHGWFFEDEEIRRYFTFKTNIVVVSDFEFKKENLKGLKGRILAAVDKTNHFLVEFEKNIGGSSGDGLGKRGRCIIIDRRLVKETG